MFWKLRHDDRSQTAPDAAKPNPLYMIQAPVGGGRSFFLDLISKTDWHKMAVKKYGNEAKTNHILQEFIQSLSHFLPIKVSYTKQYHERYDFINAESLLAWRLLYS